MQTAITLTTINKPLVIEDYLKNIKHYDHKNIEIIIVGDKKTPADVKEFCLKLSKQYSILVNFLDIKFQEDYLKKYPDLAKYLPYNHIARRNIADLLAYEKGFETIIRIDDDNYPMKEDFVGQHSLVGKNLNATVIKSSNGWYNICEELIDEDKIPFYPRGYLYSKRWEETKITTLKDNVKVVLNAGLWLGDPDVDAITRLCKRINVIKYKESFGENFILDKSTWCAINTQNTSYSAELIPASLILPYVGRYDDIWSGYLTRKIIDYMNHYISYGKPVILQKRNEHNLWNDLDREINGNIYSDHLIKVLNSINLSKLTYIDCYYELAKKLEENIEENKEVFNKVILGMKIWAEVINKIDR
mgnify:CR=1 FL=1